MIVETEFLWGESLEAAIHTVKPQREPLIEGFIYKKSAQMIWAPDGAGKSFVVMQAAIQGTVSNNRVFGELFVAEGFNTLYLQAERHIDESLERMKRMVENTPFDSKRFVLTTALQDVNLRNDTSFQRGLTKIDEIAEKSFGKPDLVVIDPIYAMVRGGLKDDEGAAYVTEFSKLIQKKHDCSVLMVHHANRGQKDKDSGARIGEDMFGSRFLSAHCSGIHKLNLRPDKTGTVLSADKQSNENLEAKIELTYDAETHLSWVSHGSGHISKTDKIYNYLRTQKLNKKTFTFDDILAAAKVSTSFLRGQVSGQLEKDLKIVSKAKHGKKIYEYVGN